jgi:tetratricopeptide (TPR) repeat protein
MLADVKDASAGRDFTVEVVQQKTVYAEAPAHAPAPAGAKPSPYYLPSFDPDSFVGRAESLAALHDALVPATGRFLLSGEPGVGKSTLALKFAWDAQKDFQAVLFQPCGPRNVEAIIAEMADTIKTQLGDDLSQAPPEQKLRAVKECLKQQRSLLVLDDIWLESDSDASGRSALRIQDLLPDPSVSVLLTSRRPSLPWVAANRRLLLDAFLPQEVEEVFLRHLGEQTFEHHRDALMEFAAKVERLPIAVIVGAQLLQSEFGPLDEAARSFVLSKLRNEVNDVPGLLRRAIESQGQDEQRLLQAAAVCVPEGFWLPLVLQIAGLDKAAGEKARNNLANAALLRLLDRETQRFQLHLLVRDQARSMAASLEELQQAHATALEELFAESESRWRDCAVCLAEIAPAVAFLRSQGTQDRAGDLAFNGFEIARRIGELHAALQIAQRDEEYWKGVAGADCKGGLQVWYGNQALILRAWGKLEEAMALHKKEEAICLELANKNDLQICYGNQALILRAWGKLEEAMSLLKKKEVICLELGNKGSLQACYGNQGLILMSWGKLQEAMDLHKKQEAICLELGNKVSLQASYANQALILQVWGKLEEALALLKKQEVICLELGNKMGLGHCYWYLGLLAREQNQPNLARQKLEQALALFTELKMPRERESVEAELKEESST